MKSQKFPLQNGTSHRDSVFTPWNRAKLEKNHFLCLKTSFLAQIYASLHFHGFEAKQIFRVFNFSRCLISKTNAATPPGESILQNSAKMYLIDENKRHHVWRC